MNSSKIISLDLTLPQQISSQEYQEMGRGFLPYPVNTEAWVGAIVCLFIEGGFFLIKRSEAVPRHKGQLAMIGGFRQQNEKTPEEVAWREYREETGLTSETIEFCGLLPPVSTSFQTLVIPVLAKTKLTWQEFTEQVVSNGEWTHGVWVPFASLALEERWTYGNRHSPRGQGSVLFCGLHSKEIKVISQGENGANDHFLLWGASARVLWNVMRLYFS